MNDPDPDLLKWLDSYQGQEWLNHNHRQPGFSGGYWATIKDDNCDSSNHGLCGSIGSYFIWRPDTNILDRDDNYCFWFSTETGERVSTQRELMPITNDIITWPHP